MPLIGSHMSDRYPLGCLFSTVTVMAAGLECSHMRGLLRNGLNRAYCRVRHV